MSWNNGYITEIDYTHGYYSELCPQIIDLELSWKRQASSIKQGMRYLELGYGQGLSLNIHAAANDGEFWGTDFNPSQAANAKELARASGAKLTVLDDSFEEFAARTDLPDFDVITVHGIWTWVSDENRKHIVEIIRRKLSVGGVVYLSYNCAQGWSNSVPLRQLMFLHSQLVTGKADGIIAQIDSAIGFVEKLAASGAQHFKNNPKVAERLQLMKDRPRRYVAHELFNADWMPMMFSDVAAYMDNAKITYVCPGKILDHFDSLNLSEEQKALLNGITHTSFKETVRDFCTDRIFRNDLFVKGPRPITAEAFLKLFREKRFILTFPMQGIPMTVTGSVGEGKLKEEIYSPIIKALGSGEYSPKTLHQLEVMLDPEVFTVSTILESLVVLAGAGRVAVAQEDAVINLVMPRTRALNRHLMDRAVSSEESTVLASPVTGAGVLTNRIVMLILRAMESGQTTPEQWAMTIWETLASQNQRMLKDGKPMEKAEDNIAELNRQATNFTQRLLPLFRALKVV